MAGRKLDTPCRTEISRCESIYRATIKTRQRKDGSLAYLSEVRVKRNGKIVHRESRTFDRQTQARAWATKLRGLRNFKTELFGHRLPNFEFLNFPRNSHW